MRRADCETQQAKRILQRVHMPPTPTGLHPRDARLLVLHKLPHRLRTPLSPPTLQDALQTLPVSNDRLLQRSHHARPQTKVPMPGQMFSLPGSTCRANVQNKSKHSSRRDVRSRTHLIRKTSSLDKVVLLGMLPMHIHKSLALVGATLQRCQGNPGSIQTHQTKEGGSHKQQGHLLMPHMHTHLVRPHQSLQTVPVPSALLLLPTRELHRLSLPGLRPMASQIRGQWMETTPFPELVMMRHHSQRVTNASAHPMLHTAGKRRTLTPIR
jgi:hypothetical protein